MRHEATSSNRFLGRPLHGAATLVLAATLAACGGGEPVSPPAIEARPAAVNDTARPIHRFAKTSNGAYFYTGDEAEKEIILRDMRGEMRYEGIAFMHSGGVPVYRFANLGNGGYFYTANPAERDIVQRTRPDMRYEGSSFSVAEAGTGGAQQVWRLANLNNGAYLYTASQDEAKAAAALGFWRDEGPAFQALPLAAAPRATAMGCFNAALWSPGATIVRRVQEYVHRFDTTFRGDVAVVSSIMHASLRTSPGGELALEQRNPGPLSDDITFFRVESGDVSIVGMRLPAGKNLLTEPARDVKIEPAFPYLFFTAPPGANVTRDVVSTVTAAGYHPGINPLKQSLTFVGFETVVVPAGRFVDACRFTTVLGTVVTDQWYAQGSGVEVMSNTSSVRHELISVTVNGKAFKP